MKFPTRMNPASKMKIMTPIRSNITSPRKQSTPNNLPKERPIPRMIVIFFKLNDMVLIILNYSYFIINHCFALEIRPCPIVLPNRGGGSLS